MCKELIILCQYHSIYESLKVCGRCDVDNITSVVLDNAEGYEVNREVTRIRNYNGQGGSIKHIKEQAAETDAGIISPQRHSTKQHKAVRSNRTSLMSSNQCVATDKTTSSVPMELSKQSATRIPSSHSAANRSSVSTSMLSNKQSVPEKSSSVQVKLRSQSEAKKSVTSGSTNKKSLIPLLSNYTSNIPLRTHIVLLLKNHTDD